MSSTSKVPPEFGKPKYFEGEKILCFHGPMLYESKILDVEVRENEIKYFVHYQGWNKNWDEWVNDSRMMKFNAAGLAKQKEIADFYSKSGKKTKALRKSELQKLDYPPIETLKKLEDVAVATNQSNSSAVTIKPNNGRPPELENVVPVKQVKEDIKTEPKKRKLPISHPDDESSKLSLKKIRIQIQVPDELKLWLADDNDLVNRQYKLVRLPVPAVSTVSAILAQFVSEAAESERDVISEFAAGIEDYFNATLGTLLLYKFERPQYSEILKTARADPPTTLSNIYGGIHLLRLFIKLGDLLPHTKIDTRCLSSLLDYCDSFLHFLSKNITKYVYISQYDSSTPEYQRLALC